MASKVPTVTFHNGHKIPILGLGTWKSQPGEVTQAVKDAIDIGYRHFDCAHVYQNEPEVGAAIKAKIAEGVVKREDLFITSKLWNTYHKKDLVEPALRVTLKNLGLDYLDLYLIHWPMGYKEGDELFPRDESDKIVVSDASYSDPWSAMEECVKKGLTRSIGVSNFNSKQIQGILDIATIKPVTNQVECHPYLSQEKLFSFCKERDITITAYSPLGSPDRPGATDELVPMKDPKIVAIASKYNKSPAQVLIRYQIERGIIVIPKSVTKSRIEDNFNVFDFSLKEEDMKELKSLDCNGRLLKIQMSADHKDYPFNIDF